MTQKNTTKTNIEIENAKIDLVIETITLQINRYKTRKKILDL